MTPAISVAVIGAGPAGLMAAEMLAGAGLPVEVFDSMPSAGRKLLVAGKGGLNLTRSEPFESFVSHYGGQALHVKGWLSQFGPEQVQDWAKGLGIETFVGTSKRVFPVGMRATPLLRAWLGRLRGAGVTFHLRHRWTGWDADGSLRFETLDGPVSVHARAVILALGGASWPVTGSTGAWVPMLESRGVQVRRLRPSNCGFKVSWTDHFSSRFAGAPVKTVVLCFTDSHGHTFQQQGEFVITKTGMEGNLIYAGSALLRDEIEARGQAILHLDLLPDFSLEQVTEKLARPRGSRSLSTHIEKTLGLRGVKAGLLQEVLHAPATAAESEISSESPAGRFRDSAADPTTLALLLKNLPITLLAPRPIEEAISSAGGVTFDGLDEHLMLKALPGVFCAGEMLDWEAPTGGYLLTASLASGRLAGAAAAEWIRLKEEFWQK